MNGKLVDITNGVKNIREGEEKKRARDVSLYVPPILKVRCMERCASGFRETQSRCQVHLFFAKTKNLKAKEKMNEEKND
jgi:hypothetical protein